MSSLSVETVGSEIVVETLDDKGRGTRLVLDRHAATTILLKLAAAMNDVSPQEGDVLDQAPVLRGRPRFQTAILATGDAMVGFRLGGMPPVQFIFSDKMASMLARDLQEITSIPRNMRYQQKKH